MTCPCLPLLRRMPTTAAHADRTHVTDRSVHWPSIAIGALVAAVPFAWWVGTQSTVAVERALTDRPELVTKAIEDVRTRDLRPVLAGLKTPFAGAWQGAKDGDVTLVMLSDYACGYCRKSLDDVARLLAEDKKLKVVYHELPVLSEASGKAAIAAMIAASQNKYMPFHEAMFEAGPPTDATIQNAARVAGISLTDAAPTDAMRAQMEKTVAAAQRIGASGTPTWIVGNEVLHGAVGYDALKAAIVKARADKAS